MYMGTIWWLQYSADSLNLDHITVYVQISGGARAEPIGQVGRSPTKASKGRALPY